VSLDALALSDRAPHREHYATLDGYLQAFYLWRALRRDGRLNSAELDARFNAVYERACELGVFTEAQLREFRSGM
jgi:hypothetical protein